MKIPLRILLPIDLALLFIGILVLLPGNGQAARLAVLTSYPPEFYQPFVNIYQESHPNVQIQILNKKTTAALEEIQKGNIRKFDLFWSSSLDAFGVLKTSEKLQHSGHTLKYKTLGIRDIPLHDPEGYYFSFALSSVGFMWNRHYLEENHLPVPTSWKDLTAPIYYGHVAMSTPFRSGTTHLIVESILQSMGWQEGWAYLLKTAGNFATITARSFSVPEGILSGRFGIGLVIDFLAQSHKSINADIDFRYGEPTLLMPAAIALLKNGENIEEARSFLDFLLSPDGQNLLLSPSINRLPVITDIYSSGDEVIPELYRLIQQESTIPYDTDLSRIRYHLVNNLFDELITYRLLERRRIWKGIIELEKLPHIDPAFVQSIKKAVLLLLSEVPVTEEQSIDQEFAGLLSNSADAMQNKQKKRELIRIWDEFVSERLRQAQILVDDALRTQAVAPK